MFLPKLIFRETFAFHSTLSSFSKVGIYSPRKRKKGKKQLLIRFKTIIESLLMNFVVIWDGADSRWPIHSRLLDVSIPSLAAYKMCIYFRWLKAANLNFILPICHS